jgi:hypothetical protein
VRRRPPGAGWQDGDALTAEIDAGDLVVRANSLALDEPDAPPALGAVRS